MNKFDKKNWIFFAVLSIFVLINIFFKNMYRYLYCLLLFFYLFFANWRPFQ